MGSYNWTFSFCDDEFWNINKTWNTEEPKLTKCLANIGITTIPNILFSLMVIFELIYIIRHPNKRISFNKNNVTRYFICLFMIIINLMLVSQYSYSIIFLNHNSFNFGDLFSSLSKLILSILLIIITHFNRKCGIITSGTMFILTLLLTTTSGILLIDSILNPEMYKEFEKQNFNRQFLCIISLFFLICFIDDPIDAGLKPNKKNLKTLIENIDVQPESINGSIPPKAYSSFLSKITFYWYTKFIKFAYKEEIKLTDIYELDEHLKIDNASEKFNEKYFQELKKIELHNSKHKKKAKLNSWRAMKVILRTYGLEFFILSFVNILYDFLNFASPFLLSSMINYINDANSTNWHGYLIAFGFLITSLLKNVILNNYFERSVGLGIKFRTAVTNLIFSKSFKISSKARKSRTTGEMVNLISIDACRFQELSTFLAFIWSVPIQIIIGFYLLYKQIGYAAFAGLLVMGIILGISSLSIYFQKKFYLKEMKIKDERIKLMNEILAGIRILKFSAWENAFSNKITIERSKEIANNKNCLYIEMIGNFFYSVSSSLVLVASISAYIFGGFGDFSAEKAFVSISLFSIIYIGLECFPWIITLITMSKVSLDRVCSFLAEDELDDYVKRNYDDKMAVSIKNRARFIWGAETNVQNKLKKKNKKLKDGKVNFEIDSDEGKIKMETENGDLKTKETRNFELKNIDLNVIKGSFVAIIGKVGSGKSSLLSAILGEMHLIENDDKSKGEVNISNDQNICYVAQQAWIQNNSLKENILFGKPFNQEIYKDVINACALEPDLQQFEAYDETEIGEKGINLSGGQKQRVSLARACYSSLSVGDDKQIILLDDPLSAVDAHVCKHLCDHLLSSAGILKNKTRILVTNQLNQLGDLNVDQIVLLKDGEIVLRCTYNELMEMDKNGRLDHYDLKLDQTESIHQDENGKKKSDKSSNDDQEFKGENERKKKTEKKMSTKKNLIEEERHEKGRVGAKNYLIYLKYFGFINAFLVIIFLIADNVFAVWSRNYLADWTNTKLKTDDVEYTKQINRDHIKNFIYISICQCFFNIVGNFIFVIGIVSTISKFHKNLLHKILRSTINFFDCTPLGRILNRFSKDIDTVDKTLPRAIREFALALLNLLAAVSIILIKQPSSFIFYFLIFIAYYFVLDLYVGSLRQLRRFDSTTKSPIYSHFSETITGVQTIRAYQKIDDFERESRCRIEANNKANWYSYQGNRWLSFNLELLSSLILMIVTFQLVFQKETTNDGEAGLLITYALNITSLLNWVVKFYSMFEANAISIERIQEYCENKEEDEWVKPFRPNVDWPKNGEIEFKNYSTKYRENTNLVLKNLSFKVNSLEKIGIVGRTGAGKSSLTLALFRLMEPVEGQIIIDDIDISQIGLHDLRSKISIIPQDPVLFTGSIRFNLDPFDKYSDDEIYRSLEHAHLKNFVRTLDGGINHKIAEGGSNLSVGQRQLVCLARALLRRSKIIVLDEATASIDYATDELVQKTIRNEFENCTIMTIAHRLSSVIDSSRILVLEKGELHEYDQPAKLLENPNSLFYSLAQKANLI